MLLQLAPAVKRALTSVLDRAACGRGFPNTRLAPEVQVQQQWRGPRTRSLAGKCVRRGLSDAAAAVVGHRRALLGPHVHDHHAPPPRDAHPQPNIRVFARRPPPSSDHGQVVAAPRRAERQLVEGGRAANHGDDLPIGPQGQKLAETRARPTPSWEYAHSRKPADVVSKFLYAALLGLLENSNEEA